MNLLNGWVVLGIAALAIILGGLGFALISRPGTGALRAVGRAATVVVVQLCVLVTFAAAINYQFGFFRNVSEVAGFVSGQSAKGKVEPVAPEPSATEPTTDPRYVLSWQDSSDPGMVAAEMTGPESAVTAEMRAWVPRGYPEPGVKYNVMLLLPGTPGNASAIAPAIGAPEELQRAIDAGEITPTLLITSDMNFGGRVATCADVAGGDKAETWYARDLPAAIRANFNVTDDANGWSVVGPSMGAYCAARMGILHPEVYGSAVWLHGIDRPLPDSFPTTLGVVDSQRLSELIKDVPRQGNLMFVSSTEDPGTAEDAQAVVDAAPDPSKIYHHALTRGGHGWAVWVTEFPDVVAWLASVQHGTK